MLSRTFALGQGAIVNLYLLREEESICSKSIMPEKSPIFQWKAIYLRMFGEKKDIKWVGREKGLHLARVVGGDGKY